MSKSNINRREKILDKALEMFNEQGIEYVGLRELAAVLDMRVSNITYYFPTKDDLVYQLSQELRKKNATVIVARENMTMNGFLVMLHQVFQHHVAFRCLLLSFVHLMEQNKFISASYKKTQDLRNATIKSNIEVLATSGYLKLNDNDADKDYLVSTIALISRFWISEAAISFRKVSSAEQISHYLTLITTLMMPYATAKAKKEMQQFLEGL